MIRVTFIEHDGNVRHVSADLDTTVMEAAVKNNVSGIMADCGGACTCATCHVYIHDDWLERTGPPSDVEGEMIEYLNTARPNSRLACQIKLSVRLDGLVVDVPENQY